MKFDEIVVIEDQHNLANNEIKLHKCNLLVGPIDIQSAEDWEARLIQRKQPYVLAQAETVLPMDNGDEDAPCRYARGYFLFVGNGDEA